MNKHDKKTGRLTLTRTTVLKLDDLKQVSGGATFDCFVKIPTYRVKAG